MTPTHSPSSVHLVWSGPENARHIVVAATTEEAAHAEIGRRIAKAEGAPIQNPTLEEIVVVGAPDPRSMEARVDQISKTAQDVAAKIFSQFDKGV